MNRCVDKNPGPVDDPAVDSEREIHRVAQVIDNLAEQFPELDRDEVKYQVNYTYLASREFRSKSTCRSSSNTLRKRTFTDRSQATPQCRTASEFR